MSSDGDELNWLATQYVLGELAELEREEFELRLTSDLAACEAVAAASQLLATVHASVSSSVALLPATTVAPRPSKKLRWPAVASSVAGLSLLGAAFWFSATLPEHGGSELSMWNVDDDTMVSEVDEPDESDDALLTIPEWLIAGVSLEDRDETKDN